MKNLLVVFNFLLVTSIWAQSTNKTAASCCDQILPNAKTFKSIALNPRNGGVGFIGSDDRLYGVHFHYNNLSLYSITNNSKVENLTTYFGQAFVLSKDGLGMMTSGFAGATSVRPIAEAGAGFPPSTAKYVYGDPESPDRLWYLNEAGYIKSATPSTATGNIPPAKSAKMFTVYARRFFMIDKTNDLYIWKPGMSDWKRFGDVKAKFITTETGLSNPLWFIGMDDQIYSLYNDTPGTAPTAMNAKAKSVAVFGNQLYYIGLDGYFYLRVRNKDIRIDF